MLELSFAKLFLLALVALVVLGPEKLPGAARTAGVLLRRMRTGWEDVRAEVARELAVTDVHTTAKAAASAITTAQGEFRDAVRRMHAPFVQAITALEVPAAVSPTAETKAPAKVAIDGHA
jgi:sec-independent protein translocase protein TatB